MPTLRSRWRAEVIRTTAVKPATQVLLLALADDMATNGQVSVARDTFAARVGKAPKYVTKAFKEAVDAGFLDRLIPGGNGRPSTYAAMIPHLPPLSYPRVGSPAAGPNSASWVPNGQEQRDPTLNPSGELGPGSPGKTGPNSLRIDKDRARAVVTAEPQPETVPRGDRLDGRRKVVNDVRDELARLTGKAFPIPWCSKVVDQIFVHGTKDYPSAYARTAIARDLAGPRRFIPTPEPPKYTATGGFE